MKSIIFLNFLMISSIAAASLNLNCKNNDAHLDINLNKDTQAIKSFLSDENGYKQYNFRLTKSASAKKASFTSRSKTQSISLELPLSVLTKNPAKSFQARLTISNKTQILKCVVDRTYSSTEPSDNTASRAFENDDYPNRDHQDTRHSIDHDGQTPSDEFSGLF